MLFYTDEKNAIYKFIQSIFNEYSYCKNIMKKHFNKNLIMSIEEVEQFEKTEICWICNKLIENDKVRDHCHITGKYRGAHWNCNINMKISKTLPIIFHNLRGYDSHLIIKELSKSNCNINVIPNRLEKEKYMSFSLGKNIVFIDSMLFLNSSLDKLVKNLNEFKYLSRFFKGKKIELVKKKGIYPDEYMDNFKKCKDICLPDKECFFNSLKSCSISDEEYQRAINVWNIFNIKNLGEYHDLYLKTDVLLLSDVFEKFINVCLMDYGLDPCHYLSSLGLAWDAILN